MLKFELATTTDESGISISKYLGCYDLWKQIIHRYQLKWSTENGLDSFNDIWNDKINYSSMLSWIKQAYLKLPEEYGNILLYCTLTGLRSEEAILSLRLIHDDIDTYLNRETMTLQHFKYPEIFIRRTKKVYTSIVNSSILKIAEQSGNHNYDSIRRQVRKNNLDMNMSYCRKIFATYLRMYGIETEIIDLLQGRIPKSVFARHYFRPDFMNNSKIRSALDKLCKIIL